MNNNTANVTSINVAAVDSELVQQAYLSNVYMLSGASMLTLLVYTMVLAIPQEMEYMWLSPKPFSIPNILYVFTRYGSLIAQGLVFSLSFNLPLGLCNFLTNAQSAVFILAYTGIQGLLVARAYSLCQGNKIVAGALAFFFMGGIILFLCYSVTFKGCSIGYTANYILEGFIGNICTISADALVFCVCLWKVWGTWKLKREVGIRSSNRNDLVPVLVRQAISRLSFVIVFTITISILGLLLSDTTVSAIISSFQRSFSAILIAEFALDLRQQNSPAIFQTTSNVTLPTIQFRSVVNYLHQSILVEMGDYQNTDAREGDDDLLGSQVQAPDRDVETQREEVS